MSAQPLTDVSVVVWSAPTFATAAARLFALDNVTAAVLQRTEIADDTLELTVAAAQAERVTLRTVLVLTDRLGRVSEWRVRRVVDNRLAGTAQITATGLLGDLNVADIVTVADPVTGDPTLTFTTFGDAATVLQEFAFAPAAAQGVTWLVLGDVPPTVAGEFAFSEVTPLGVLTAVRERYGLRVRVTRDASGRHRVDLPTTLEPDAPPIRADYGANVTDVHVERDDNGLANVIRVTRDDSGQRVPYPLSDAVFVVTGLDDAGDGRTWVTLDDPTSDEPPILVAGQLVGRTAVVNDQLKFTVESSRVNPTPAVLVSNAASIQDVAAVRFEEDDDGTPLLALTNPPEVLRIGRVVARLDAGDADSLRNLTANGDFANVPAAGTPGGPVGSSDVGAGVVSAVWPRAELGQVVTAQVNGTVGPSDLTLPLRGLPPGARLLDYEICSVTALSVVAAEDFLPDSDGRATFAIAPAPALIADNTTLGYQLDNVGASAQADGAIAAGATSATLDGLPPFPDAEPGDVLRLSGAFVAGVSLPTFTVKAFTTITVSVIAYTGTGDTAWPFPSFAAVDEPVLIPTLSAGLYITRITANGGSLKIQNVLPSPVTVSGGLLFVLSVAGYDLTLDDTVARAITGDRVGFDNVTLDTPATDLLPLGSVNALWLRGGNPVAYRNRAVGVALSAAVLPGDTAVTFEASLAAVGPFPAGTTFSQGGTTLAIGAGTPLADSNGETIADLVFAPGVSLADGLNVTFSRPVLPADPDVPSDNLLLTLSDQFTTFSTAKGTDLAPFRVVVGSSNRPIVLLAWGYLWSYFVGSIRAGAALVNATTNTVLASQTISPYPTNLTVGADGLIVPVPVLVAVPYTVTATADLKVRLSGARSAANGERMLWRGVAVYDGSATDSPFTASSFANGVWQRAQRALAIASGEARTVRAGLLDTYARETLAAVDPNEIRPGRTVIFPELSIAADVNRAAFDLLTGELVSVELATRAPRVSSILSGVL